MVKIKSIEQKYRKLTEVEHALARSGRYIGSISPHTEVTYTYDQASKQMVQKEVTYNPGFLKLFDEVISNSIDHSKRPEGKGLDTIRVEVDQQAGSISIYDNGGIPVVKHSEYNQWIPEMIFELRAGSNFDDSDEAMLTGQNGEGAALTNIFSTKFVVETCDGKNKFKMVFQDNSQDRKPAKVTPAEGAKGYTKITYYPDFEKLNTTLTDDNVTMLLKRVVDVAGLNAHLKVYWNGERITARSFKDYIEMYIGKDAEYAYDETDHWRVGVAASDNGFQHVAFVNGTHTKVGGTHIQYAGMQIWEKVREYIKKKHKVDVKPAELRQHMMLFIDCSIVNPRYSSQTKDDLITEVKDYKTSWSVPDKMINKIIKSNIIQSILDWATAKAKAAEMAELRKLNKDAAKTNPKRVEKFDDAIEKVERHKCGIFFTEGDCLDENTQIVTQGESLSTTLKDIQVGDLVLTHNNVFKPVVNKTYRLKDCIKFTTENNNTIICSREHKLMCYSRKHKSFGWASAETIAENLEDFSLIENEIISKGCGGDELVCKSTEENGEITLEFSSGQTWVSSPTHRWMVYQLSSNSFKVLPTAEFQVGDMLMMRKN